MPARDLILSQLRARLGAKWSTAIGLAIVLAQGAYDLGFLWFLPLPWCDPMTRALRYTVGLGLLAMNEAQVGHGDEVTKELMALRRRLAALERRGIA